MTPGLKIKLKSKVSNLPRCFLKKMNMLLYSMILLRADTCSVDLPPMWVIVESGTNAILKPAFLILRHRSTSS